LILQQPSGVYFEQSIEIKKYFLKPNKLDDMIRHAYLIISSTLRRWLTLGWT